MMVHEPVVAEAATRHRDHREGLDRRDHGHQRGRDGGNARNSVGMLLDLGSTALPADAAAGSHADAGAMDYTDVAAIAVSMMMLDDHSASSSEHSHNSTRPMQPPLTKPDPPSARKFAPSSPSQAMRTPSTASSASSSPSSDRNRIRTTPPAARNKPLPTPPSLAAPPPNGGPRLEDLNDVAAMKGLVSSFSHAAKPSLSSSSPSLNGSHSPANAINTAAAAHEARLRAARLRLAGPPVTTNGGRKVLLKKSLSIDDNLAAAGAGRPVSVFNSSKINIAPANGAQTQAPAPGSAGLRSRAVSSSSYGSSRDSSPGRAAPPMNTITPITSPAMSKKTSTTNGVPLGRSHSQRGGAKPPVNGATGRNSPPTVETATSPGRSFMTTFTGLKQPVGSNNGGVRAAPFTSVKASANGLGGTLMSPSKRLSAQAKSGWDWSRPAGDRSTLKAKSPKPAPSTIQAPVLSPPTSPSSGFAVVDGTLVKAPTTSAPTSPSVARKLSKRPSTTSTSSSATEILSPANTRQNSRSSIYSKRDSKIRLTGTGARSSFTSSFSNTTLDLTLNFPTSAAKLHPPVTNAAVVSPQTPSSPSASFLAPPSQSVSARPSIATLIHTSLAAINALDRQRALENHQPPPPPRNQFALRDFDLVNTLGTGSFGRVHLARVRATGKFVALKALRKAEIVRLRQVEHTVNEKKILEALECPFLVGLLGSFQDAGHCYLVLEYVQGGELFSYLRRVGKFEVGIARYYAAQVVAAFEYMHGRGIVYRDLKPENLLIDARGHIKITDFGFAKVVHDVTWTLCGTPDYLAPEIIQSKGYGKAVDWWALGILIYEMIAGHPPFFDDDPFKLYEKILACRLRFPPDFDPDAKDLVKRLLTPDLTMRYGNLRGGAADVKAHRWFDGLDWAKLHNLEIAAPWVPEVEGEGDAKHFEKYAEGREEYGKGAVDMFGHLFKDFN
ncbi:camp-dependent protein kinase catalytic subunit [Irineochytrium annulatum]|nr:camp-dependent protein kinase catalytic subunit [Irineochytrium annulatum]